MKKSLGKGLDALIPAEEPHKEKGLTHIPIEKIRPNSSQPRKNFDEELISELAKSISEKGIIQPLTVRQVGENYEIIAGERRWRASQKAGLRQLPVVIKNVGDNEVLELALIENLQREDLNPIEEARAYGQLMEDFGLTHEQISERIGKSRSTITNQIRLLNLTEKAQEALIRQRITTGHARAILGLEEIEKTNEILQVIIKKELTVRQTEELIKSLNMGTTPAKIPSTKSVPTAGYLENISDDLKASLGTKVVIKGKSEKGKIEIEYYSKEELERLIGILKSNS